MMIIKKDLIKRLIKLNKYIIKHINKIDQLKNINLS